jgi:hypothetical protein
MGLHPFLNAGALFFSQRRNLQGFDDLPCRNNSVEPTILTGFFIKNVAPIHTKQTEKISRRNIHR